MPNLSKVQHLKHILVPKKKEKKEEEEEKDKSTPLVAQIL